MIKKLKTFFLNLPLVKQTVKKLKTTYIGKHKVSMWSIGEVFIKKLSNDHLAVRAKSITFDFFLSIFPAIIFVFTLIPYFPIPNLDKQIIAALKDFLPNSIYQATESTVLDILNIHHSQLLSFGFILAFYTANNGIISLINTFNHCYKTKDDRNFIIKLGVSMSIMLLTLLVVSTSAFGSIVIHQMVKQYNEFFFIPYSQLVFVILVEKFTVFTLFLVVISIVYYIGPSVHERWTFFSIGSVLAAMLCFLFTMAFTYYIDHFNSYNKLYGSIGALIGILLWMYVNTLVLLVGFELNASIQIAKRKENFDLKKL
jgi:membrane protein